MGTAAALCWTALSAAGACPSRMICLIARTLHTSAGMRRREGNAGPENDPTSPAVISRPPASAAAFPRRTRASQSPTPRLARLSDTTGNGSSVASGARTGAGQPRPRDALRGSEGGASSSPERQTVGEGPGSQGSGPSGSGRGLEGSGAGRAAPGAVLSWISRLPPERYPIQGSKPLSPSGRV